MKETAAMPHICETCSEDWTSCKYINCMNDDCHCGYYKWQGKTFAEAKKENKNYEDKCRTIH